MQMKRILKRSFIPTGKTGTTQQQQLQENNPSLTSQPFTLRNISNLLLNDFIRCYTEEDLSPLIISGKPTKVQLQKQFTDIAMDYHDLIGSAETRTMLMMRKKYIRQEAKIQQVVFFTHAWLLRPNKELKEKIKKLGFHFDSNKSAKLILDSLDHHLKAWKIDLEVIQKDIQNYLKKKQVTEKVTRKTFLENIVAMKKEGFDVDLMKTMTDEYAVAVNAYNQLIETRQQQAA